MAITQLLFWGLTILTLGSALMVIFSKNPVHSILWLIVTFFSISGHYVLLNAQFLAIVNIIVYAGAIMVLFLFVVMLMNLNTPAPPLKKKWLKFAGVLSGSSLMLVLIAALKDTESVRREILMHSGDIGLINSLGMVLFKDYILPFEISSVLFLSAMVGAVVIGKKN
ncbi:NADH-quinone oxidoreductase subunit J [Agriterribacter sp.]|uniref:NADH-quinone oxidoreductase subunit J family protein n=1 Tax=Agriterribacter sp. TaxID=2821509 RepID=UPI002BB701EF|nr:NADH-quinone oxidoreductase subunit J [Agriterribacter sp.]HRP57074.1 NADH-quinone oxidoreductase subunit J [Agriterribacter sp.]